MVTCWWIYADIGEIEIERDKNPLLCLRGAKYSWIGGASQLLSKHGMDVMTGLLKQDLRIARKILVEFKSDEHPTRLSGDGNDTFSRQVRCIADRCGNMLRPKRGVLIKNAFGRFACSEIVQNYRYRYSRPSKAHGAMHDLRISRNVGFPIHLHPSRYSHHYIALYSRSRSAPNILLAKPRYHDLNRTATAAITDR